MAVGVLDAVMLVFIGTAFVAISCDIEGDCIIYDSHGKGDSTRGSRATDSLQFLVIVSRHGNRGGHKDFPNNIHPLNESRYWPYGTAQLTTYGRVQMHTLGQKVRQMYGGYLSDVYKTENVRATSTAVDRTLMSGQCFLAGLYPPKDWQIWNKDLLWQPAVLYSDSPDKSDIKNKCSRRTEHFKSEKKEFDTKYSANRSDIFTYISRAINVHFNNTYDLFVLWDQLISQETEGFPLPNWTKSIYPEPLNSLMVEYHRHVFAGSEDVLRLSMGSMFKDILMAMVDIVDTNITAHPKGSLLYYSGHDSTLTALQAMLTNSLESGTPATIYPRTGSAIIYELHQELSTKLHIVKVLYIDGSSSDLEPISITLPTCGYPCYFKTLFNVTLKFTSITDYRKECEVDHMFL